MRVATVRTAANVAIQIALLALIAAAFFLRTPQVSGLSMEPRIHPGEFVLINTFAYRVGPIARGEIVAFRHESRTGGEAQQYIKRIIAIPGDRVKIDRGTVRLNGAPLNEVYVAFRDTRSYPEVTIPAGAIYVLGDNRANSDDSRDWGFVPQSEVIGRAVLGIWPLRPLGWRS